VAAGGGCETVRTQQELHKFDRIGSQDSIDEGSPEIGDGVQSTSPAPHTVGYRPRGPSSSRGSDVRSARTFALEPSGKSSAREGKLIAEGAGFLKSRRALAKALGLSFGELSQLANATDTLYQDPLHLPRTSGLGFRRIDRPRQPLKKVLKRLHVSFSRGIAFPGHLYCGIRGRSPAMCARRHLSAEVVVSLDIANFYPSITERLVRRSLRRLGAVPEIADLISVLVTLRDPNIAGSFLPQGSPASSVIANLVLLAFDTKILLLAEDLGVLYTRYADDIELSGFGSRDLIRPIVGGLRAYKMGIQRRKTRVMSRNEAQAILGLNVNRALNPARKFRAESERLLRARIRLSPADSDLRDFSSTIEGKIAYARSCGGGYHWSLAREYLRFRRLLAERAPS